MLELGVLPRATPAFLRFSGGGVLKNLLIDAQMKIFI